MKALYLLYGVLAAAIVILAIAHYLGFDTKFPRGFLLLALLDLAVLKAYVFFLLIKEILK